MADKHLRRRWRGLNRRQMLSAAAGGAMSALAYPNMGRAAATPAATDGVLDAVIIGAGIAGMTAARDLARAGNTSFVVCEARDRVGGRTLNHQLGGGYFSEAGGQWIGPGQTAIIDLIDELGIGSFRTFTEGRSVYLSGGHRAEEDMGGEFGVGPTMRPVVDELDTLSVAVPSGAAWTAQRAAELDAVSVYDFARSKNVDALDMFSLESGATLTNGSHPSRVSLLYFLSMLNYAEGWEKLEGFEGGGQEQRIEGGSQWVSQLIAQQLGERVRLASPVREVRGWDSDIVSVHTDRGELRARQVVFAMAPALCNQIVFDPPLPQARQELQRRWPAHGPGRKTAHVYERPFWREKGLNGWIFQIGGSLMWAYDNSPQDASIGVLNAFVHPSLPRDPAVIEPMLLKLYAEALGNEALQPLEFHDHDWGADPWTLTCVSPLPPGFLTSGFMDALRAPVGRLIWSGTETAEIWHGYMDGAVRSGHRAASDVLSALAMV